MARWCSCGTLIFPAFKIPLGTVQDVCGWVPVVLSRVEAGELLEQVQGTELLMGDLMYGGGLRMRKQLSRISGGLATFIGANVRPIHPREGARLSKLRPGKAVTSHTRSTGFATPGFPFTLCALFRSGRLDSTRAGIGMSKVHCLLTFTASIAPPGETLHSLAFFYIDSSAPTAIGAS